MIALQNFVVSCHTSTRISHRYTNVPSLLDFPPISLPIPPSACHRAPVWVPWVTLQIPTGYLFYTWYCKFLCYSLHTSSLLPPLLPTLQPVTERLFEYPESHSKFPLAICYTHGIVNFYVTLSIHLPFSLLFSHLVHMSVLYVCFSIAALKINSSVPSFQIPYILPVYDIYISFWLTSLCIIGSSFVQFIRTQSNVFLFMASSIPLYICSTASLYIDLSMDI